MRLAALSLASLAALATAALVYLGSYGLLALSVYLIAVVCIVLALSEGRVAQRRARLERRDVLAALPIVGLVALQLALARYFGSFSLEHFHQDEFETAYASYSLPSITQIQWFTGYPAPGLWVASFPSPFFVLQKPFFMLLGPTVDAIRISVWPYLALTVVYLYLLAREISPRPAFPIAASICAMVFAPSLYIDSLGVHFHGATLFLIASMYYAVRLLRTERRGYAVAAGLSGGLAYLGYPASYITLPLVLGFVAFEAIVRRSARPLRLVWPTLVVFAFVMLPFVVYALTKQDYFVQRMDQINAIGGSEFADPALAREGAVAFLLGQLWRNLQSLVLPGIVIPGYSFGRQAFFEWSGAALFALGLGYGVLRVLRGGSRVFVLVLAALVAAFLSGMVLMLPTGAFHRITLVFPLVGLTVALGLLAIYDAANALLARLPRGRPLALGVASLALAAFAALNLAKGYQITVHDQTHDSPALYTYVEEHVPASETVGIAYAPAYHLGHELFFRTGGRQFVTEPLPEILAHPPSSVFILAYPTLAAVMEVKDRFPGAKFVAEVDGVRLSDHFVVLTGQSAGGSASG